MRRRYGWNGTLSVSLGLLVLGSINGVYAIGQNTCVSFESSSGSGSSSSSSTFPVVSNRQAAPILLSADDWSGVHRTASDFQSDIHAVTGVAPVLRNVTASTQFGASTGTQTAIIVGTLGRSSLIDAVVNRTGLDVSGVRGQWEAFLAREVQDPLPGIERAYVVVGADQRGTIYAMYDHSEQFGASGSGLMRPICVF